METTRRDAMGLMGAAAAAAAMGGPALAQGARNLGSKTKTLFWVASCTPCDKNLKFDPAAFKDALAWFKHNGADGVVKYTSAHVDYAESEFIVRSGHSCQGNPLTIEEVRRILLENLGAVAAPVDAGGK